MYRLDEPLTDTINRAQREILRDIADGCTPADVASFSELHEYTDANLYGIDGRSAVAHATVAAVQDAVNEWLEAGRPPTPLVLGHFRRLAAWVLAAPFDTEEHERRDFQFWTELEAFGIDIERGDLDTRADGSPHPFPLMSYWLKATPEEGFAATVERLEVLAERVGLALAENHAHRMADYDDFDSLCALCGVDFCGDCGQPITYSLEGEAWYHTDPDARPCFLIRHADHPIASAS